MYIKYCNEENYFFGCTEVQGIGLNGDIFPEFLTKVRFILASSYSTARIFSSVKSKKFSGLSTNYQVLRGRLINICAFSKKSAPKRVLFFHLLGKTRHSVKNIPPFKFIVIVFSSIFCSFPSGIVTSVSTEVNLSPNYEWTCRFQFNKIFILFIEVASRSKYGYKLGYKLIFTLGVTSFNKY